TGREGAQCVVAAPRLGSDRGRLFVSGRLFGALRLPLRGFWRSKGDGRGGRGGQNVAYGRSAEGHRQANPCPRGRWLLAEATGRRVRQRRGGRLRARCGELLGSALWRDRRRCRCRGAASWGASAEVAAYSGGGEEPESADARSRRRAGRDRHLEPQGAALRPPGRRGRPQRAEGAGGPRELVRAPGGPAQLPELRGLRPGGRPAGGRHQQPPGAALRPGRDDRRDGGRVGGVPPGRGPRRAGHAHGHLRGPAGWFAAGGGPVQRAAAALPARLPRGGPRRSRSRPWRALAALGRLRGPRRRGVRVRRAPGRGAPPGARAPRPPGAACGRAACGRAACGRAARGRGAAATSRGLRAAAARRSVRHGGPGL
ncbi:unnamed protein product, partial [Prorocentrum cordatum]